MELGLLSMRRNGTLLTLTSLLALACGDLGNGGERERPLHDLSRFALTQVPAPSVGNYRLAEASNPRTILTVDQLFEKDGDLWSFTRRWQQDELIFARHDASGAVIDEHRFAESAYGLVASATADGNGNIWIAGGGVVQELHLATGLVGRGYTTAHAPVVVSDGTNLFLGAPGLLRSIDPATGTVVEDFESTIDDVVERHDWQVNTIAFTTNLMLIGLRWQSSDIIAIDRSTGRFVGFVGNVPRGGLDSGVLLGRGAGLLGMLDDVTLVDVALGAPLPEVSVNNAIAFEHSGARAITAVGNELWVLYADKNGANLVGYDAATRAPLSGYALDPALAQELYDEDNDVSPFGLSYANGEMYVVAMSPGLDYLGSRVRVIDHTTGNLARSFDVPQMMAGLCHDGTTLHAVETPGGFVDPGIAPPELHELDDSNGLSQSSRTVGLDTKALPSLVCATNAVTVGASDTRLQVRLATTSTAVDHASFPLLEAGSGVEIGASLFMIAPSRNVLFEASRP